MQETAGSNSKTALKCHRPGRRTTRWSSFASTATCTKCGTRTTASFAAGASSEWIITAVSGSHEAWILGCVGYYNYRFFLLFAFWAAVWCSSNQVFILKFSAVMQLGQYDQVYSVCNYLFICFAWFMFFFYGGLALKGLTIIEAAEKYNNRRSAAQVGSPERSQRRAASSLFAWSRTAATSRTCSSYSGRKTC